MNDIQKQRYDRFFKAYEDSDGYLTLDSLTAHAEALAAIRRQDPDSPAVAALREELRSAWGLIRARTDTDGDSRISRDEFYAAGEWLSGALGQFDSVGADWPLTSWIQSLFGVIDADGDGRISQDEYADWLAGLGLAADTDIGAAFAGFDKNHDGSLSREEFAECSRQFWTIFDVSVPGNRWLGP